MVAPRMGAPVEGSHCWGTPAIGVLPLTVVVFAPVSIVIVVVVVPCLIVYTCFVAVFPAVTVTLASPEIQIPTPHAAVVPYGVLTGLVLLPLLEGRTPGAEPNV